MKTLRALLRWPFEVLALLKSIDARLTAVDARLAKLEACVSRANHQNRPAITVGHWNDTHRF